jgi:capsule biosynthesis phosphatase
LGTPNQLKSFSSNFNIDGAKYRFCFDLDNTLVSYPKISGDYSSVEPIKRVINFSNFLYDQGHTIIIHTARRMRTHGGNVGRVQADISKITFDTLDKFDIKYHEIYFGKPYAQFYIDDLAVSAFGDLEKETGFYNIHPKTRDHNKIEIFDNYIIKTSEYIDGEKYFYQNIPDISKKYFPKLLGYDNNSIKLSKIEGIPISFLNTSGILTEKILSNLFTSLDFLHKNKPIESNINIYSNYLSKFNERIDSYDFSNYDGFMKLKNELIQFLDKYESEKRGIAGLIHGDPVLTNILIDSKDCIKFIDMRGKLGSELSIYGDLFYDWAKLYQSIIGYDYILMDKDLNYDNINKNKLIFEDFIINKFGEDKLDNIKQITKSLILTLIPIHNNYRCQMFYNLIKTI